MFDLLQLSFLRSGEWHYHYVRREMLEGIFDMGLCSMGIIQGEAELQARKTPLLSPVALYEHKHHLLLHPVSEDWNPCRSTASR